MLENSRVATRLPAIDLQRAEAFYAEKLGLHPVEPGLQTRNGIAEVTGNYPSKGGIGEKGSWFRDGEGNLLGIGQPIARRH
jgi:hypothetical protein